MVDNATNSMETQTPVFIRKHEFLGLVHISPRYLDLLIERGTIPSLRLGRCVLIPRDEALARLNTLNSNSGKVR